MAGSANPITTPVLPQRMCGQGKTVAIAAVVVLAAVILIMVGAQMCRDTPHVMTLHDQHQFAARAATYDSDQMYIDGQIVYTVGLIMGSPALMIMGCCLMIMAGVARGR